MSGGTFGTGIKWTFDQLRSLFRVNKCIHEIYRIKGSTGRSFGSKLRAF